MDSLEFFSDVSLTTGIPTASILESFASASPDAIAILCEDGTIACWNESAAKIFGCEACAAIGRPFRDYVAYEIEFPLADANSSGDPTSGSQLLQVTGLTASGKALDLNISYVPLSGNAALGFAL